MGDGSNGKVERTCVMAWVTVVGTQVGYCEVKKRSGSIKGATG